MLFIAAALLIKKYRKRKKQKSEKEIHEIWSHRE
jgi:hypothetical protein